MAPVGTFTCENTTPVTVQRQYHQSVLLHSTQHRSQFRDSTTSQSLAAFDTTPVTVQRQYHQSKSCCIQQTPVRGQKNFHAQVWLKVNINLVSVGFSLNLDMQGAEATECESHGYLMLEMLTHRPTGRPRYYMYAVCTALQADQAITCMLYVVALQADRGITCMLYVMALQAD